MMSGMAARGTVHMISMLPHGDANHVPLDATWSSQRRVKIESQDAVFKFCCRTASISHKPRGGLIVPRLGTTQPANGSETI